MEKMMCYMINLEQVKTFEVRTYKLDHDEVMWNIECIYTDKKGMHTMIDVNGLSLEHCQEEFSKEWNE